MHSSIGKPLVAFVSAACLAAPTMVSTTTPDSVRDTATIPVELSAAVTTFDPVPPSIRSLNSAPAPASDAALVDAVDTMAELSGVDRATLLLELLTAPYHNFLGVSKAVGSAVNAVLQVASLPFSVVTYVLTNRTNEIPDYIASVRKNLDGALPGISSAIKTEVQYDLDLLSQVFGSTQQSSATATKAITAAADPVDQGTLLLQLLTIPYHNFLGVSKAVGSAANAYLQLASLPFSVVTYVLTNRTNEIPAYVDTVKANVKGALPGISSAVKSELAYNKSIIDQVFGGNDATVALQSRHAPNLLAGDDTATTVLDSPHPFLARLEATEEKAPESTGGKHRAPEAEAEPTVTPPSDHESDDTSDTKSDNKSDNKFDTKSDTKSDTKADPTGEPKAETETKSETESKTDSKAGSTPKSTTGSLGGKHRKKEADAA
ncbi:hypothetical protein FK535_01335 [Mycolicibacterium sp. 018/SC-01/001]|uniref:hypothetical protein n=1 Tax=Mycolicibacterium sp. 018/SC-01/001 TaxID=2592069 RepID=UPI001180F681|nr:hypothetical protein [Mycolicibacterium sp. 018/SC-01/001]TRW88946.1 hypothetical protein FK535_01335 [Mycolicibacterium sp. 018/SC-01/001]